MSMNKYVAQLQEDTGASPAAIVEAAGRELPEVSNEDNGDVLTVVNGSWGKAAPSGGGGIAFGCDTFFTKWEQNPDYENVYDITIYAFSGNELHAIGTCDASREADGEMGEYVNIVVGSITFTDSDYEIYEYLLYSAINGFAQNANYSEFFLSLVDGQFPTFGIIVP